MLFLNCEENTVLNPMETTVPYMVLVILQKFPIYFKISNGSVLCKMKMALPSPLYTGWRFPRNSNKTHYVIEHNIGLEKNNLWSIHLWAKQSKESNQRSMKFLHH